MLKQFRLAANVYKIHPKLIRYESILADSSSSIDFLNVEKFMPVHRNALNISFENVKPNQTVLTFLDLHEEAHESKKEVEEREAVKSLEEHSNQLLKQNECFSSLLVNNLTKQELIAIYQGNNISKMFKNNTERSIAVYLYEIFKNEPVVNKQYGACPLNFVNYLVTKLGFNEYPFTMFMDYKFSFNLDNFQNVNTKPTLSFMLPSQNICLLNNNHFLYDLTAEDNEYHECQIGIEMVAAACTNYHQPFGSTRLRDQLIYSFRVVSSQFTFYKAYISESYIKSLEFGLPPSNEQIKIYRYPDLDYDLHKKLSLTDLPKNNAPNVVEIQNVSFGLDYANILHRPIILSMFINLKERLLKQLSNR